MTTGNKLALCIGINHYPGTGSDLKGCVNDARDWAKELDARGFKVDLLLDRQATGTHIRRALAEVTRKARSGDTVVITYSGHGSFVPDTNGDEDDGMDECWCPHDVATEGVITDDEMFDLLDPSARGVRTVVISDSCHSGTMTRFATIDTPPTTRDGHAPQRLVRFLPPEAFNESILDHASARSLERRYNASPPNRDVSLLMAGCQDSEYSYDAWFEGRANGAFTFVALRELKRLTEDATYQDWHERIRKSLPSLQYPQAPKIYGTPEMESWKVFEAQGRRPSGEGHGFGQIEDDPIPGSRKIAGAAAVGRELAEEALAARDAATATTRTSRRSARARERVRLVAEGDSWFDYPWTDILSCLEDDHEYIVHSLAHKGDTLEEMAYSGAQLVNLIRMIDRLGRDGLTPNAILLSGGGNDIAGDELAAMLDHRMARSRTPEDKGLNQDIVRGVVDNRLRDSLATIISAVTEVCIDRFGRALPILVHGYDYVIPDGRGYGGGWGPLPGPWLEPSLRSKGYSDMDEGIEILRELIDRFNRMQVSLIQELGMEHVTHIDLRKGFDEGTRYKKWWANELHPTKQGFRRVSDRFQQAIDKAVRG